MCTIHSFCGYSLRIGTWFAFILSQISISLVLVRVSIVLTRHNEGEAMGPLEIPFVILCIILAVLFTISNIFLFLSIWKEKDIFLGLWLNCCILFVFAHAEICMEIIIKETHYIFAAASALMAVIMLYMWIIVLNYRGLYHTRGIWGLDETTEDTSPSYIDVRSKGYSSFAYGTPESID